LGNWEETFKLTSPNPEPLGYFGFSTAIDGDFIVVGAYNEDEDAGGGMVFGNAGAVYVYQLQPNGDWQMMQRLVSDDPDDGDLFGYSVALSGDYLLVGAWSEDHDANGNNTMNNAGSAFVFERQPNGTWNLVEKLVGSDRAPGDEFGKQVDIRGEYAIIGAAIKMICQISFSKPAPLIFSREITAQAHGLKPKSCWPPTVLFMIASALMLPSMAIKPGWVQWVNPTFQAEARLPVQEQRTFSNAMLTENGKKSKKFMPWIIRKGMHLAERSI
jgi:hypothetical protein